MTTLSELVDILDNYQSIERDVIEIQAIAPMTELEVFVCIMQPMIYNKYTWDEAVQHTKNHIFAGHDWNPRTNQWTDPNYTEAT